MTDDTPTYEELKRRSDDLTQQVMRSRVVGEELLRARDRLDRELSRFRSIQSYADRAIHAADLEDFARSTVEAILETFEVECAAVLTCGSDGLLHVAAAYGSDELAASDSLDGSWLDGENTDRRAEALISIPSRGGHPWESLNLAQAILCPYFDRDGEQLGFLLGGVSSANRGFYDEITDEIRSSFKVLTQQMNALLLNAETKEALEETVSERTKELRAAEKEARELSEFLNRMFGRYLSPDVMAELIRNPAALELGGERRSVTLLESDLRGFTAISERLEPEQVVAMLNTYFEAMVGVIRRYGGSVTEIIGDALIVVFGAPQKMPDRTERAIACAIEMQNAMPAVNRANRAAGLPALEMGIGIHDTAVIVGNIGSEDRRQYTVIGPGVNLVSRIESYTVGGQILVSETVHGRLQGNLVVGGHNEIHPKGHDEPLTIYDVIGIGGDHNLSLGVIGNEPTPLHQELPVVYTVLTGKHLGGMARPGAIIALSTTGADVRVDRALAQYNDLRIDISGDSELQGLYAKVTERVRSDGCYRVRFTSVPPPVERFIERTVAASGHR